MHVATPPKASMSENKQHSQTNVVFNDKSQVSVAIHCLQCFDAVGWVAGRASGL